MICLSWFQFLIGYLLIGLLLAETFWVFSHRPESTHKLSYGLYLSTIAGWVVLLPLAMLVVRFKKG
jgi:uncharacterized membrane protein